MFFMIALFERNTVIDHCKWRLLVIKVKHKLNSFSSQSLNNLNTTHGINSLLNHSLEIKLTY